MSWVMLREVTFCHKGCTFLSFGTSICRVFSRNWEEWGTTATSFSSHLLSRALFSSDPWHKAQGTCNCDLTECLLSLWLYMKVFWKFFSGSFQILGSVSPVENLYLFPGFIVLSAILQDTDLNIIFLRNCLF